MPCKQGKNRIKAGKSEPEKLRFSIHKWQTRVITYFLHISAIHIAAMVVMVD